MKMLQPLDAFFFRKRYPNTQNARRRCQRFMKSLYNTIDTHNAARTLLNGRVYHDGDKHRRSPECAFVAATGWEIHKIDVWCHYPVYVLTPRNVDVCADRNPTTVRRTGRQNRDRTPRRTNTTGARARAT